MNTSINIQTLSPEQILRKEPFKRIIPSANLTESGFGYKTGGAQGEFDTAFDPLKFQYLTQSDFLREFDPNSHRINSIAYYPNQFLLDKNSNRLKRKIKSRVAIAWQRRIHTKRLATITGNNIALSIANSTTGKDTKDSLNLFREGWQLKDIENALFKAFSADLKTGDCAVNFYRVDGELGWKVFCFEDGDILYPHYDPVSGRLAVFGRRYSSTYVDDKGQVQTDDYLEVWDDAYYARYIYATTPSRNGKEWVVEQPATRHNFSRIPIAYHRYGEPCWAASQSLIDTHELAMSQLAENNAAFALRILVLMGAEMDMESSTDGTPTVINSSDVNAKASFLEPADSSGSFGVEIDNLAKDILRCSFCVETPEVKGSDLSSLTVKMLYADAFQKALEDAQTLQPFLNDVVAIFKEGYGVEIGRSSDFETLKVKAEILPYYFLSETETVNALVQLKGSGILSARSATAVAYEQLGYGDIDEHEAILQEEHDTFVQQSQASVNVVNNARRQQSAE